MRKINYLWIVAIVVAILPLPPVNAQQPTSNKYVTIVNPIRSRELWKDKSLKPVESQYGIISGLGLKATWLIQDDVVRDKELVATIKQFNPDQELGLFLEVSQELAKKARVYYPTETEWYAPKAVFLSGYKPSERIRLIDTIMADFKNTFGIMPKSAGAWWIDSWSQQYLEEKYQIKTVMIVADQKTTDNYGVWGQWWGYPYHPSPANILVPGNSKTVVIQWAQRDWEKAYLVPGSLASSYSLQANDYTGIGLKFDYFEKLAKQYLSVENLGQITIGLETGMESVGQENEYVKQLRWLVDNKITSLKMSQFGDIYRGIYKDKNPKIITLGSWVLTPEYRQNSNLAEKTEYNAEVSFGDKFLADKTDFLNRVLPRTTIRKNLQYFPLFLLIIPLLYFYTKKVSPILWVIVLFLPVFRSFYQSGWKIYFGPVVNHLIISQLLLIGIGELIITKVYQKLKVDWSAWWAVWVLNLLALAARVSVIEGKYYAGFLVDSLRFVGVAWSNGVKFINQDLPGQIAAAMLKFNPEWIWGRWYIWLILYPLIEISLVLLINKILPKKLRFFLAILSVGFVYFMFKTDPVAIR